MTRKKPITDLALFQEKTVRRIWHEEQWFYSVIDVIAALTRSERPSKYWDDLKRKLKFEGYAEVTEHIQRLKMAGADGKNYPTDAVDTKTLLRVIQSIPSPNAEPFKRWLAKVGAQRLEEIDNPELLAIRQREYYKAKGYPEEWIEARMRGQVARNELTDEWKARGAKEGIEYAILTNEMAEETFGLDVEGHTRYKDLDPSRDNLRDHETPLELALTYLVETAAKTIHETRDSEGFDELSRDARDAGAIGGRARVDIEEQTGQPVISPTNYKHLTGGSRQVIAEINNEEPQFVQPRLFGEDITDS